MNEFIKPVERPVNTRQETQTSKVLNNSGLTYTLCDRTDLNSKLSNYFTSFNLPHNESVFTIDSNLSKLKPELQQLNVDRMVICPIDKADYNEILDGRSVTLTVPQSSGVTSGSSVSAKTIVSSTYTVLEKKESSELLGSNVSFLFCDEINKPYTGTTADGMFSNSGNTTWNPASSFVNRPPAVSYLDLEAVDVNTDQRPFSGANLAVPVSESYPTNTNQGYNYDIPVGFVALDKGWFVFTHPSIVDNIPYNEGYKLSDGALNIGPTSSTTEVFFTDNTISNASFVDINVEYKTSIIALVFPTEFFFTTNQSWDREKNYQEQQNGTFGYDPVSISEIALYNAKGEILAISKLDRPLVKQYNDLVTFNLDINI